MAWGRMQVWGDHSNFQIVRTAHSLDPLNPHSAIKQNISVLQTHFWYHECESLAQYAPYPLLTDTHMLTSVILYPD